MSDAAAAPAPSLADLESRLTKQREALARDLEMLGFRLAPESLKQQARQQVSSSLASMRSRAFGFLKPDFSQSPLQLLRSRLPQGDDDAQEACAIGGCCAVGQRVGQAWSQLSTQVKGMLGRQEPEPAAYGLYAEATESTGAEAPAPACKDLPTRLRHLLDDASDGDPTALAITTGVVLCLAGVSTVALVKAVRR